MTRNEAPQKEVTIVLATLKVSAEAVSTIVRHAQATQASIPVTESASQFQSGIQDNGRGLSAHKPGASGGLGLRNVIQRTLIHDGEVVIENAPGSGTHIPLTLAV